MNTAALKQLVAEAEKQEADQTLAGACSAVGIGVGAVQSRDRGAEVARKRAVVAWILRDRLGWPRGKVAAALCRTERQIKRLVGKERVASPIRGT